MRGVIVVDDGVKDERWTLAAACPRAVAAAGARWRSPWLHGVLLAAQARSRSRAIRCRG